MTEKQLKERITHDENHVIVIEHLKKSFGDKQVLTDINLKLKRGENLAVLGKSGEGKSVTIKCIVGLLAIDAGSVIILGQSIVDIDEDGMNELRKRIGFLFQGGALYDSMTVRENLLFPLQRHEKLRDKGDLDKRVKEALDGVGLPDVIDKMPSDLSGGMRKRVALARTLVLKPDIMLYDEPTTGLDTITSREISKLILEMQKRYKTSSIIITHDMSCAKITADRILILKEGEFVAEGTYEELENSEDKFVRSFFEI